MNIYIKLTQDVMSNKHTGKKTAVYSKVTFTLGANLFAGVGGLNLEPFYSRQLEGWPSIEELKNVRVTDCEEALRKNILYHISAFASTGKASDIKRAETLFEFYKKINDYNTSQPIQKGKPHDVEGDGQKRKRVKIALLLALFICINFVGIDNGKVYIKSYEDVLVQLLNTLPNSLICTVISKELSN